MGRNKDIPFQIMNSCLLLLFAFLCFYPFYYIFLVSVSSADAVAKGGLYFFPSGFTIDSYVRVLGLKGIIPAFVTSVSRTVIGTVLTLFFSAMLAYIVTKKELIGRKWIYRGTIFTMFVNAGLIPWFITMKTLGLSNSFLLYVLPTVISPFAVVLIKTYMESISPSLEESALIDGAGYFRILYKIMIPVSMPVIAAVAVFSAVSQWNSWQDNFFLVSNRNLQTMQYILINYLQEAESIAQAVQSGNKDILGSLSSNKPLDPFSIRTTVSMVTVIPIIAVYPFVQRYFVKGIMLGAVKG
ncbi:carbohydrate ABC transporter permease [Paenibacillus eucommiae]|uniref:ABC-type glycerol-3-phosphate transport system permease component n=1 Tax=Paenibacillus eucommiae TaxID=1355755 RepID=A0ABS4ITN4_9BACL|nr:carbohydrate ABC transporter permease [Paenibacillus eucommiae]MBP1990932.1 ABC-type glycerol-3-phosphate transport system permease component [Paenibacillus eucommiae]